PGYVNVLNVVHPPVSVLGPVKTAGTYDFTPGMTVLHAVALAGGIERQPQQPWQFPEYTREIERLQTSLDRAARMMARAAVLKNERAEDAA
ncbi:SLBB domain-containing protein, partial [Acinetobacter baumannii]